MRRFFLLPILASLFTSVALAQIGITMKTTISLPGMVAGAHYSQNVAELAGVALDGKPCTTCQFALETPLPVGLTLASEGIVAGTPKVSGALRFTYTVRVRSSGARARGRVE